jgi:small-conductance mechanosensitive channel
MRRDAPQLKQFLEERGRTWREAGRALELSRRAARRARIQALVLLPVLVVVLVIYSQRRTLLGPAWDSAVRFLTVLALVSLGWQFARAVGRAFGPTLLQRLDPGTAGTVGFLMRLATMVVTIVAALRVAGLTPREVALGGAVTAVVVGLAAQQTFGNLIAGTVLLTARPFSAGDRVRLQGGGLAGSIEGTVSALGLLYTTLASREGPVLVPNATVLAVAVVPLTEPTDVDLRARLRAGVTPGALESLLGETIDTPLRGHPRVTLEEVDGSELVVRIAATPADPLDGPRLAAEVLNAIAPLAVGAGMTATTASTAGGDEGGVH